MVYRPKNKLVNFKLSGQTERISENWRLVNILYIKLVLKRKKSEPTEYIPVGRRQYSKERKVEKELIQNSWINTISKSFVSSILLIAKVYQNDYTVF